MTVISRRNFLKTASAAGLLAGISCQARSSPVINGRLEGSTAFRGHKLLENNSYSISRTENTDVLIIGSGVAGLSAAYFLNKFAVKNIILLELEDSVGGNSRYGINKISKYPLAAHYLPVPNNHNTDLLEFLEEAGAIEKYVNDLPFYNPLFICHESHERLYMLGKWQEGLIPNIGIIAEDRIQYEKFNKLMAVFRNSMGDDGRYAFEIPLELSSKDDKFLSLDRLSMYNWLLANQLNSEPLHWYVNYCCRDDYGTDYKFTSAWAGIHYFAARRGNAANAGSEDVLTWPEGNGWLTDSMRSRIKADIRTGSMALKVSKSNNNFQTDCVNFGNNDYFQIHSDAIIFACPEFITRKIFEDGNISSFDKTYSPWLVANISTKISPQGRGAKLAWDNVFYQGKSLGYVVAKHQESSSELGAQVLTYYHPLSENTPQVERERLKYTTFSSLQSNVYSDLTSYHPELRDKVEAIDIALWPHAMVRPTVGFLNLSTPESEGVCFANSDQSGISIFEQAFYQGSKAAKLTKQFLQKRKANIRTEV